MGARQGTQVEIAVEGADLDDAASLHFSTTGISAIIKSPGVFTVSVSSNVPPGLYEVRVIGRFGISNPRFLSVGDIPELSARGENLSLERAMTIAVESTINAFATAAAADFYQFEAPAGQNVTISCLGEPFDSRMKPSILLFDAGGRELQRERRDGQIELTSLKTASYLLKVHDLQFRGGKQFPYRLTITARTNLGLPHLARLPIPDRGAAIAEDETNGGSAQAVSVPCEIVGSFFPAQDVDRFSFEAKKGDVFWIEIISDRAGAPTDPFLLIQRETSEGKVEDLHEFHDIDANLGGPIFNTSSRDPAGRFEVKEDGRYRAQVRDLFNTRTNPRRSYRLSIRREAPDFDLIALVVPPAPFDREKREAKVWSPFLRRNDTLLLKVLALRRDNFSGEITLSAEGLPAGARASESVIPEGQNATWLSISSDDKTPDWHGAVRIVGKAKDIERVASAAVVLWDVPDYNNESVRARLTKETILATTAEPAPFAIEPKQTAWQVPQSTALSIPLRITRSADFKQSAKIRAYLDIQNDPIKEWDIDGTATETTFEFDLKNAKLATGTHHLHFLAQTAGKMRRIRAGEVTALETRARENEAERKSIEDRLALRDVSAIFASPVVKLFINPAPTASK